MLLSLAVNLGATDTEKEDMPKVGFFVYSFVK